jgi:hypothetical protein
MSGTWQAVIGSVISAALALGGVWLTQRSARHKNSSDVTQQIIDQLQENHQNDRADWGREKESLNARQSRLEARLERAESVSRLLLDYVSQLRHHIDSGSPPPPPPYPQGWPR